MSSTAEPQPSADLFHVLSLGPTSGPYSATDLRQMAQWKQIDGDTPVVRAGVDEAPFPVRYVPGVFSPKAYLTALLLALCVGFLAVDRFYLGHVWLGVLKLLANLLTLFTLGSIWTIIDIVLIANRTLTDRDGLPLR